MNLEQLLLEFNESDKTLGKVVELLTAIAEREVALQPLKKKVLEAKTPEDEATALHELQKAKEGIAGFGRDDEIGLV